MPKNMMNPIAFLFFCFYIPFKNLKKSGDSASSYAQIFTSSILFILLFEFSIWMDGFSGYIATKNLFLNYSEAFFIVVFFMSFFVFRLGVYGGNRFDMRLKSALRLKYLEGLGLIIGFAVFLAAIVLFLMSLLVSGFN